MATNERSQAMNVVRQLHKLGALRVKVGDIEAEFAPQLPPMPPQPKRMRDKRQEEMVDDYRRQALGAAADDAGADDDE